MKENSNLFLNVNQIKKLNEKNILNVSNIKSVTKNYLDELV